LNQLTSNVLEGPSNAPAVARQINSQKCATYAITEDVKARFLNCHSRCSLSVHQTRFFYANDMICKRKMHKTYIICITIIITFKKTGRITTNNWLSSKIRRHNQERWATVITT